MPEQMASEGLVAGAIQITPAGEPIVMLANHPTTGGYPVIAVVDRDDVPIVAQARAGHRPSGSAAPRTWVRLTILMERRIYGLENEYGVTCTLRGQRRLSPDEVARYLFRRVVSWGRSSNVFLQNGARLYLDVGSHPEYATPECDSLYDLVVHDKAGERILEQLVESAEQRLAEESIRGTIYLFKNNTDSAGNSYGCHENYCTNRDDDLGHYAEVLIPFFVSRQIYTGAGKVLQTARGATLLDRPTRRAHLGGRVVGHHAEPPDHQHP